MNIILIDTLTLGAKQKCPHKNKEYKDKCKYTHTYACMRTHTTHTQLLSKATTALIKNQYKVSISRRF